MSPQPIEDLLHRRTDLSTFLVHFTRQFSGNSSKSNLLSILSQSTIEARTAFGMGKSTADRDIAFRESQKVACFTETPIEHAWMMCTDIQGRVNSFGPYGLAFTKVWARSNHANPVWYLDISARGGQDWLTVPIDELRQQAVDAALRDGRSLCDYPITRVLPFIEQMGPLCNSRKEFWWEREWRHVGPFRFHWDNVVAAFAPHEDHNDLQVAMTQMTQGKVQPPPLLDPDWGLEQIMSRAARRANSRRGPVASSIATKHFANLI